MRIRDYDVFSENILHGRPFEFRSVEKYPYALFGPSTHVDRPQNGVNSHDLLTGKVAHCVEAKHIPGKSVGVET